MKFTKKIFIFTKKIFIFTSANIFGLYSYIEYKKIQYKNFPKDKINIVFDLDQTLIHTDKISKWNEYNKSNMLEPYIVKSQESNLESNRIIWVRPWVKILIPIISQFNNVYLFTRATKPYADDIVNKIEIDKYFIEKKYRIECASQSCKDLNKFNIDSNKSYLVDDKLSNNCPNQKIYHIPQFNNFTKYDYEILKLFGWILFINIKNDLLNVFQYIKQEKN